MYFEHKIILADYRLPSENGDGVDYVRVELDLPEGFGLVMQKAIEKLNDINNIQRTGALGFSLPKTNKNIYYLERYEGATIIGDKYRGLNVEVWAGHTRLNFNQLLVRVNSDRDSEYECELVNGDDFWLDKADKTLLYDLDFGTFEFTKANVYDNMQNNYQYTTGNDLVYLPLVDYGNGGTTIAFTSSDVNIDDGGSTDTITLPNHGLPIGTGSYFQVLITSDGTPPAPFQNNSIHLFSVVDEDKLLSLTQITDEGNGQHYATLNVWNIPHIRPLFSVPGLLQSAFSQIGWKLEGEILEHPDVRRWWDYILGKEFYDTGGNEDFYYFLAENAADQVINTPSFIVQYDTATQEEYGSLTDDIPSGITNSVHVNDTGGRLKATATTNVIVENTTASPITFTIKISVYSENAVSADELFREQDIVTVPAGETQTIELELQAELRNEYVTLVGATHNAVGPFNIKAGTFLRVQPQEYPKWIIKGSTHDLAKMIDPEMTILDVFKGFLHLGDFKLKTDHDLKTVSIYPGGDTEYEGVDLNGFLLPVDQSKEGTAIVERESRVITPPTDEQPRVVTLKFRDSSDDYITDILIPDDDGKGVFGRSFDFGERYTGPNATIENPLYEPTVEKQTGGIISAAMWDNTSRDSSYSIKPRIVYAFGWLRQVLNETFVSTSDSAGTHVDPYVVKYSFWYFEGDYEVYVPYVSQFPQATVFDMANPEYVPTKNIVYGTQDNDLYNTFWTLDRFTRPLLPEISFLLRMSLEDFTAEDFRTRWFIYYRGEPAFYRLIKLIEHNTGDDSSTDAVFIPE